MENPMKKTLWIAIVGALAASVIATSAQEVLSANAVGYIKRTVPEQGKLAIVTHPLNSMSAVNLVFTNTSVASDLPVGSKVYFWNAAQSWGAGEKKQKGTNAPTWDGVAVGKVLSPGESFFLQSPLAQVTPVVVTITGEVPENDTASVPVAPTNNLSALGNPYPVDVVFTNTSLASNASVGAKAYFWNPAGNWGSGEKKQKGTNAPTWDGTAVGKTIAAGEGFFMQNPAAGGLTWTNARPYTWPHE
jgi:hypothetical protein